MYIGGPEAGLVRDMLLSVATTRNLVDKRYIPFIFEGSQVPHNHILAKNVR